MIFEMPNSEGRPAVVELSEALPKLVRRLDSEAIEQVEERIAKMPVREQSWLTELTDPHALLDEQVELWAGLARVLDEAHGDWSSSREHFENFSAKYFGQLTSYGRRSVMLQYLRQHAENKREFQRDKKALDNYLDFEVLQERHAARLSAALARIRVCLVALRRLGADILARHGELEDRIQIAVQLSRSVETKSRAGAYLDDEEHPESLFLHALLMLEPVLTVLLEHSPDSVPANWVRRIVLLARDERRTSWEQIAALRIAAHDRESGLEILEGRLETPGKGDDDWHVRAHAARLLARRDPVSAMERFASLELRSDAVAMAACEALGEVFDEEALEVLERFALPEEERRPKVRVAALMSCAKLATAGGDIGTAAAVLLARGLSEEPVEWVIGCLHEEIDELLADLELIDASRAAGAARVLRDVLGQRLENEPDAAVANRLAELRLQLADRLEGDESGEDVTDLIGRLASLSPGETLSVPQESWDRDSLMRAMARVAVEGYGLYARRRFGKWRVERGESFRIRLWRVLHEFRHPAPNKRQGHYHAHGRVYGGTIRAHPEKLGEVTPTAVPGERRQITGEGGWGPYLPLVDDLLDAQLHRRPIELVSQIGITTVSPPRNPLRRLWNFWRISWHYARLDRLRTQSIEGDDRNQRSRFLAAVESDYQTEIGFDEHLDDDPVAPMTRALFARTAANKQLESDASKRRLSAEHAFAVFAAGLGQGIERGLSWLDEEVLRLVGRGGSRIVDLAVAMLLVLALFLGRLVVARHQIDRWRSEIPLCIGGWGSRGKSGTERIKAGLFQGLGYDVFVKTTGCEAMFIHAGRGTEAREIFIYRPYDKATIWEQRDMLRLGTELNCDVFLWECMALSPRYVDLLQSEWMRDDLVTLTNAYPDHEDIQGPAGVDVARTIAGFLPNGGEALTTEREMLPVLQEEADRKGTSLKSVGERGEHLIPDDVLERFPYNEHPRNIALVAEMAQHLGVDREFAIFQMADNVVPDLGVLKEYPEVNVLGRQLSFICGNSANERAGFMNNWTRMGLDKVDPAVEMNRRVVTVINNRYDRVSRSKVFADIMVRDISADRHILIGTNLSGLKNYLAESLDNYLEGVSVFPDGGTELDPATIEERLHDVLVKLRLQRRKEQGLVDFLEVMVDACGGELDAELAENCRELAKRLIESASDDFESMAAFRQRAREDARWSAELDAVRATAESRSVRALQVGESDDAEWSEFVRGLAMSSTDDIESCWLDAVGSAAAVCYLEACRDRVVAGEMTRGDFRSALHKIYRERFWEMIVTIDDPEVSGEYIVRRTAEVTPPGTVVSIMGSQNIKGTGLDFVYRWVELNATVERLDALETASPQALMDELRWFEAREDIPLLDALVAWRRLRELDVSVRHAEVLDRVRTRLAKRVEARWRALDRSVGSDSDVPGFGLALVRLLEGLLEPLDAVSRRWKAEKLQKLLVEKRISHPRMVAEMQALVKRQKGGWLVEKLKKK